jgi:hypothetical protein
MPRLLHGKVITLEEFQAARERLRESSAENPLAFATARPTVTEDFDFMFPELQRNPENLLPKGRATRDALVRLGQTMRDADAASADGDAEIPAAYTYFGQFVDHDITLEAKSADVPDLLDPDLEPLSRREVRTKIENGRTATLDLDSVYGFPAPRDGARMRVGEVTGLPQDEKPFLRPPGKSDRNDLPREPRQPGSPEHDRAALIGDPRNDENTVIAQLHVAFLRAHNRLVNRLVTFGQARRHLRRYYQYIVLHDFLKRIADPRMVEQTIERNRVYDAEEEQPFMPLEFSVAAYRFGHSMVRSEYDFNLNFNLSGEPGTFPASLQLLFSFSALSGQLGDFDTLPENWIVEWHNFLDGGGPFNKARLIDTRLVEPLFELRDLEGNVIGESDPDENAKNGARLAVRNLLRGYLLRLPTGQAIANTLRQRLAGVREIPVLTAEQLEEGAASGEQVEALRDGGFLERTPLWYYVLAEAAVLADGQRLGPVGSTIVAEVLVGLVRRSENSILRRRNWAPTLPGGRPGPFTLRDLLDFAGVL